MIVIDVRNFGRRFYLGLRCLMHLHPSSWFEVYEGRESDGVLSRQVQRIHCRSCGDIVEVKLGEWFTPKKDREMKVNRVSSR